MIVPSLDVANIARTLIEGLAGGLPVASGSTAQRESGQREIQPEIDLHQCLHPDFLHNLRSHVFERMRPRDVASIRPFTREGFDAMKNLKLPIASSLVFPGCAATGSAPGTYRLDVPYRPSPHS